MKIDISGERTFNDLVLDAILFKTNDEAKLILENMFPEMEVHVSIENDGSGIVVVGDIKVSIQC